MCQVIQKRITPQIMTDLNQESGQLIYKIYKGQWKSAILGDFFAQFCSTECLAVFTPDLFALISVCPKMERHEGQRYRSD